MDKSEPPQSFSFKGNVSQGWKLWLKHFEFYLTTTEKDRKNDKSVLLACIRQKGREIYETFILLTLVMKGDLHLCYRSFLNTATQIKNVTILRHKFFTHLCMKGKTSMISSQN